MKTFVTMSPTGRLTVPAAAREALRVAGEAQFEVEVTEHEMILRPVVMIPREDAWAYTPEHMASLARALEQANTGRVRAASAADLGGDDEGGDAPSFEGDGEPVAAG